MGRYLAGAPLEIRAPALRRDLGRRIAYVRSSDIDHSGRGYVFPRYGVLEDVERRRFFDGTEWIEMRDTREIVLID